METNKQEQDILKSLFHKLEQEPLPGRFNEEVMQQVLAESARKKKREERLTLLSIGLASAVMVALAVATFCYFEINLFTFRLTATSSLSFCLFICLMVILLLLADYKLRQIYYRKHAGSHGIT